MNLKVWTKKEMDQDIYLVLRHIFVNIMTDRGMDGELFLPADSGLRCEIHHQQAKSADYRVTGKIPTKRTE